MTITPVPDPSQVLMTEVPALVEHLEQGARTDRQKMVDQFVALVDIQLADLENTPGCTYTACVLRELRSEAAALGASVPK